VAVAAVNPPRSFLTHSPSPPDLFLSVSYGRQPAGSARRGCAFRSLPPVLQLHLKRFEYDVSTGEMRKLDDTFAFPTTLKLRR
jgi:ubiquitin carboxyl-terminal hydrolase 7